MDLKRLIQLLEEVPPDLVFPQGFGRAGCWEGDWYEIAFEPAANATAGEMLAHAKNANGATLFRHGRGGSMEMDLESQVHIARPGECDRDEDPLSIWRWRWMLKAAEEAAK